MEYPGTSREVHLCSAEKQPQEKWPAEAVVQLQNHPMLAGKQERFISEHTLDNNMEHTEWRNFLMIISYLCLDFYSLTF